VREFLQRIGDDQDKYDNAEKFVKLAKTMGGRSEKSAKPRESIQLAWLKS